MVRKLEYIFFVGIFPFLLLSSSGMEAREDKRDVRLDLSLSGGQILGQNSLFDGNKSYLIADFSAAARIKPGTDDLFARKYNYPCFGAGIAYESFSMIDIPESRMGDVWSAYALFKRDLVRSRDVSFGYGLQTGLAYSNHRYDPVTNPGNYFFSFPLNFHLAVGLYCDFNLGDHWKLSMGARFKHHSNGRLMIPNQGVNMIEAGFSAGYSFGGPASGNAAAVSKSAGAGNGAHAVDGTAEDEPQLLPGLPEEPRKPLYRPWNFHLCLGGGFQSTRADWRAYNVEVDDPHLKQKDFKEYPRLSLTFDAMYRYCLKCSSGLALELYYYGGLDELRLADERLFGREEVAAGPGYHHLAVGLALVHEFHYKNLSLSLALGAYPYKKIGICSPTSWNYQKAGIRWYIPKASGLFLGYSVKATDFRESEYMEVALGFRF